MLRLTEYERSEPISLTAAQLRMLKERFHARFEPADGGRIVVIPGSRVGTVVVDRLHIAVRPKLPVTRLLRLVAEAADPYLWLDLDAQSLALHSLEDAVAALFARSCLQTFQRGVLRSYHREQQSLPYVRGRMDMRKYAQSPHPLPIPVTSDVFDDDNAENQVLRAALYQLQATPALSERTRVSVGRALRAVDHVHRLRDPLRTLKMISLTRQNYYYSSALTLARMVLDGGAIRDGSRELKHSGFVIDMPRVVEQWVRVRLRRAWNLPTREMRNDWSGQLWLDGSRRIELIPDLAVRSNGAWRFVGDVKYKVLRDGGARQDDVYQMLAYLTGTGLPQGALLYAGIAGPDETLQLPLTTQRIHVVSVNLDSENPGDELLKKVAARGSPVDASPSP